MTQTFKSDITPRWREVLMVIAGVGALALNHWLAMENGAASVKLSFLGPPLLLLGIGGIYDPRIVKVAEPGASDVPTRFGVIAIVLVLLGFATSVWLLLGFY